jgi:putative transposase
MVGLDLGITSMVALSTGETVGNPKYFARAEQQLAKAQRRLARKKKGSKNRAKARLKVARIHARIADRRRDYQHKLSTRIVHENQVVCVESLAVKNMVKIDQWYPSSKTCHACKHILESLALDIREWVCPACGMVHDRDANAACYTTP